MARAPFTELVKRAAESRAVIGRSLEIVSQSLAYVRQLRAGTAPGPLLLALRAANQLAQSILERPSPTPTPAQRRALLAAAVQIRALAARIIVNTERSDPQSMEAELSRLVARTLALIEQVTAEPDALATADAPNSAELNARAIDVESWSLPRDDD